QVQESDRIRTQYPHFGSARGPEDLILQLTPLRTFFGEAACENDHIADSNGGGFLHESRHARGAQKRKQQVYWMTNVSKRWCGECSVHACLVGIDDVYFAVESMADEVAVYALRHVVLVACARDCNAAGREQAREVRRGH